MARIPEASYERYLMSEHWQRMRLKRIRFALQAKPPTFIDTVFCTGCERFVWMGRIHVHHRTYERIGQERIADLEVLCAGCHAKHHGHPQPQWYIEAEEQKLAMVSEAFVKQHRGAIKTLSYVLEKCLEHSLCMSDVQSHNAAHAAEDFEEFEVPASA